jgi:hypothetical protein
MNETMLQDAAKQLADSRQGRAAMEGLRRWLTDVGLTLDGRNKEAVLTLLQGAWGGYAGTALEVMETGR